MSAICTLCGDELPGIVASDRASFCESCALTFVSDPVGSLLSNGAPVFEQGSPEMQDALTSAYATLALCTFECLECVDVVFQLDALDAAAQQRFLEGAPVDCPICGSSCLPGPSDIPTTYPVAA
jgi:hypothetical protein